MDEGEVHRRGAHALQAIVQSAVPVLAFDEGIIFPMK